MMRLRKVPSQVGGTEVMDGYGSMGTYVEAQGMLMLCYAVLLNIERLRVCKVQMQVSLFPIKDRWIYTRRHFR